jgi:hypothetical protein
MSTSALRFDWRGIIQLVVVALSFAETGYSSATDTQHETTPEREHRVYIDPFVQPDFVKAAVKGRRKPSADTSEEQVLLKLKGILLSVNQPLANIDGQILSIGEQIGGYMLIGINETAVELEKHGQRGILQLDAVDTQSSKGVRGEPVKSSKTPVGQIDRKTPGAREQSGESEVGPSITEVFPLGENTESGRGFGPRQLQ